MFCLTPKALSIFYCSSFSAIPLTILLIFSIKTNDYYSSNAYSAFLANRPFPASKMHYTLQENWHISSSPKNLYSYPSDAAYRLVFPDWVSHSLSSTKPSNILDSISTAQAFSSHHQGYSHSSAEEFNYSPSFYASAASSDYAPTSM